MSNVPTPYQILPTPAEAFRSVVLSSQHLIENNPSTINDLRPIFLQFYANPIFTIVQGLPTQQQPIQPVPLTEPLLQQKLDSITSTLAALSQTMKGLMPKPGVKNPSPTPLPLPASKPAQKTPTYNAKAASPPRPSLVLDLNSTTTPTQRQSVDLYDLCDYCQTLNADLPKPATLRSAYPPQGGQARETLY